MEIALNPTLFSTACKAARSRLRPTGPDEKMFVTCLAVNITAVVASAAEGRSLGQSPPWVWAGVTCLLVGLGLVAFKLGTRAVRSMVAGAFAVGTLLIGLMTFIPHLVLAGSILSDYLGLLSFAAGFVMLWLSIHIGLSGLRLRTKAIAVAVLLFVLLQWGMMPAVNAGVANNVPRSASPGAATLGVQGAVDVTFLAKDGTRLVGWYAPGQNGAAVILLGGSHSTRAGSVDHLRMLSQAGFAVLAYDARGHGQSSGPSNAYGWMGDDDIAGAITFLRHQPGIDPARIAILGLSMGGEQALRAAADGLPVSAVVAEGAGVQTMGENSIVDNQEFPLLVPVALTSDWVKFRVTELLTTEKEPASLVGIVGNIHVPVLIISSNREGELSLDQLYQDRIGATASLWYVPDAGHMEALNVHPQEYASRVTSFLDSALSLAP